MGESWRHSGQNFNKYLASARSMSKAHMKQRFMMTTMRDPTGRELVGHGWVILTIASLKFKNYFIHASILALTLSKRLKKGHGRLSEDRAAFQG